MQTIKLTNPQVALLFNGVLESLFSAITNLDQKIFNNEGIIKSESKVVRNPAILPLSNILLVSKLCFKAMIFHVIHNQQDLEIKQKYQKLSSTLTEQIIQKIPTELANQYNVGTEDGLIHMHQNIINVLNGYCNLFDLMPHDDSVDISKFVAQRKIIIQNSERRGVYHLFGGKTVNLDVGIYCPMFIEDANLQTTAIGIKKT